MANIEKHGIGFTRVNNDINGNPRYVVHFLSLLSRHEKNKFDVLEAYAHALGKSRRLGGRKFHNRQYGGGIVFTTYNLDELARSIAEMAKDQSA